MKIIKNMIKYAIIAIFVGGLVAVIGYFQNGAVDILEILQRSGTLFVLLCVIVLIQNMRKKNE